MAMSPLVVGSARFRVGRRLGGTETADLVVLSEAATLTAERLTALCEQLRRRGFCEVFTAAVDPPVRDMLAAGGFAEHERLQLLSHGLTDLPERPSRRLRIRRGRRSDRRGVLTVDHETFDEFWRLDQDSLREAIRATPLSRHRVVRRDGTVAGYSVVGVSAPTGFLQRLAVAPRHQGKGLGAALVADSLHWARRHGASPMWVNTQESNHRAQRFYLRLGFKPAGHQLTVLQRRLSP